MSDVAAMYADMKRYRDEAVRLQQEVIVWQQEAQSAERKAAARIAGLEAALLPFADAASLYDAPEYDYAQLAFMTFFIVADLRAARIAYLGKEDD